MCPDDKDHACGQRNSGKQGEPRREKDSKRVEMGCEKWGSSKNGKMATFQCSVGADSFKNGKNTSPIG